MFRAISRNESFVIIMIGRLWCGSHRVNRICRGKTASMSRFRRPSLRARNGRHPLDVLWHRAGRADMRRQAVDSADGCDVPTAHDRFSACLGAMMARVLPFENPQNSSGIFLKNEKVFSSRPETRKCKTIRFQPAHQYKDPLESTPVFSKYGQVTWTDSKLWRC
jgi:hypothetical protein